MCWALDCDRSLCAHLCWFQCRASCFCISRVPLISTITVYYCNPCLRAVKKDNLCVRARRSPNAKEDTYKSNCGKAEWGKKTRSKNKSTGVLIRALWEHICKKVTETNIYETWKLWKKTQTHARIVCKTCPEHVRHKPNTRPTHVQKLPNTFPTHVQHIQSSGFRRFELVEV